MVGAWLLAGCGANEREPISASTLALTAQQNVERVLRGTHAAGSFLADSATLAKLLSSTQGCDSTPPCAAGAECPPPETTCDDAVSVADLDEARADMTGAIDDLVETLREDVFIPANLESENGEEAVYLLREDFLCKNADPAPTTPNPGGVPPTPDPDALDPDCVEQAEKLQPRLRLTSPRDGQVDVAILLTASQRNPVTLQLATDRAGIVFDLAEIKASLDAAGQDTENLKAMSGKLAFELVRNGELDYSARLNVLSSLSLTTIDDLAQQVAFSLAGSSPSFELRLDGNAKKITGTYDFGSFGVKGPLNAFRDSFDVDEPVEVGSTPPPAKTYTGIIELLVGGFDGKLVYDGNRDKLNFTGLGLGDVASTLKHDGVTLATLDLNPASGRHFDLTVEQDDDDKATLTFLPTFDLRLAANFAPLQSQIDDIPPYLLNDTVRLWFDGPNPSIRTEPDQLRVLSGTLNMSSSSVPAANVQVTSGMCLLNAAVADPSHELLGEFTAGACEP